MRLIIEQNVDKKGRRGEEEKGRIAPPARYDRPRRRSLSPFPPFSLSYSRHAGLSLIEVLASIGIISIGLLGLASLLPVGLVTIFNATKADRAGNCGRLAMREIAVRRMLDPYPWPAYPAPPNPSSKVYPQWLVPGTDTDAAPLIAGKPFAIDPEGAANGITGPLGGLLPRITLGVPPAVRQTNRFYQQQYGEPDLVFRATDDIIATAPENMKPAQPPGRPIPVLDASKKIASKGDYSWFATVMPCPSNPARFTVSVVVCYARTLNPSAGQVAEAAFPVATFSDAVGVSGGTAALAGGSIQLDKNSPMTNGTLGGITVRENDWVALVRGVGPNSGTPQVPPSGYCQWYRVAAIGDNDDPTQGAQLTLVGPDWISPLQGTAVGASNADKLVVLGQEVVGVYTTTIDLDTDLTWKN